MPDEDGMLGDMEFEDRLNDLGENQPNLIRFIARQQFATGKVLVTHGKKIKALEKQNRKLFGIIGGGSALVATAITAALDYFLRR